MQKKVLVIDLARGGIKHQRSRAVRVLGCHLQ